MFRKQDNDELFFLHQDNEDLKLAFSPMSNSRIEILLKEEFSPSHWRKFNSFPSILWQLRLLPPLAEWKAVKTWWKVQVATRESSSWPHIETDENFVSVYINIYLNKFCFFCKTDTRKKEGGRRKIIQNITFAGSPISRGATVSPWRRKREVKRALLIPQPKVAEGKRGKGGRV